MQAVLQFIAHVGQWKFFKRRARKQLERKVEAGTNRAIQEYRTTFEKLKEYDKR